MLKFELSQPADTYFEFEGEQYRITMYDGYPCAELLFVVSEKKDSHIYIESLHVSKKHRNSNKHYGSILLDYTLNRMFVNLSETHQTILLTAAPFDISEWRILKKHIKYVNIPELLEFLQVESIRDITKDMIDDNEIAFRDMDIFDYFAAENDELVNLITFYQRFGFKIFRESKVKTNKVSYTEYEMKRPNEIIPVPGLARYRAGNLASIGLSKSKLFNKN
jgi:ribosomal protein S18 acetylase RimI-like enzyme